MKITYRTLLTMVDANEQPNKVKVGSALYEWNGCDYVLTTDSRRSLTDTLTSWTAKAQTTAEFIDVVQEILTDKEKEYLSAVIKPFKNKVDYISKNQTMFYSENYQYISFKYTDDYCEHVSIFPVFEKGSLYKSMELDKEYTLEELGL